MPKTDGTVSHFEFLHNTHERYPVRKGNSSNKKERKRNYFKETVRSSRYKVPKDQNTKGNKSHSKLKYTKYGKLKPKKNKHCARDSVVYFQNKHWRF